MQQNSASYWDELRALPFPENYPTEEASQRLYDEMLFQRACQVVLWSMPAMSVYAMKKGSEAVFGAGSNVLVVWKDRLNPKTLISTPNSDVIYALGYVDLKQDGPTVIEVPPKQQGILDDFWQRPITDVGYVGPEDWSMRGMMASLGIVKGEPFAPDERMREILASGAEVGVKMSKALRFGDFLPGTLYYEDRQWNNVLNIFDVEFKEDTLLNVDARVGMFIIGYSISPAMVMEMVGAGSKYPFAYRDMDGNYLSGSKAYKLHIPANVPAANFWSVTLYDAINASGLDNGQPYPSIGSLDDLQYNEDGSVHLYFGPELPAGAPESNWLRTVPGKGWFTLFRLYSPTEAFFDQTWRPGDFEKIS